MAARGRLTIGYFLALIGRALLRENLESMQRGELEPIASLMPRVLRKAGAQLQADAESVEQRKATDLRSGSIDTEGWSHG